MIPSDLIYWQESSHCNQCGQTRVMKMRGLVGDAKRARGFLTMAVKIEFSTVLWIKS